MPKRKLHHSPTPQESTSKKTCTLTDPAGGGGRGRRVRFREVKAYYFPRAQGFCCVPSSGGTALGMSQKHEEVRVLTLGQHEAEIRKKRERVMAELETVVDVEEDEEEEEEVSEDGDETESCDEAFDTPASSSTPSATHSNGHYLSTHSNGHLDKHELPHCTEIPHHHHQTGEDLLEDDQYYLQPLMAKQRVTLLREAGVESLNIKTEKEACQEIRESRQVCGCSCEGSCEPETCDCALSGIRCQVDRASFPCACTKADCRNPSGRIEFDPIRVRSHFLNTMLRLKMADKGEAMTPSRHMRFERLEEGNGLPTTWDASEGPGLAANASGDSGIDSPSEPVSLSSLYAHQAPRENGFHPEPGLLFHQ